MQEKATAQRFKGRVTLSSGALPFDKADALLGKIRTECKRTDKEGIYFTKSWISKMERETSVKEDFAFELEIQDKRMYIIPEKLFKFLVWSVSTPLGEIIKALQDGEYKL